MTNKVAEMNAFAATMLPRLKNAKAGKLSRQTSEQLFAICEARCERYTPGLVTKLERQFRAGLNYSQVLAFAMRELGVVETTTNGLTAAEREYADGVPLLSLGSHHVAPVLRSRLEEIRCESLQRERDADLERRWALRNRF